MSSIKRKLEQVSVDLGLDGEITKEVIEHVATKKEEKEYRTPKQFAEICDSMINGQWSHAAIECVKYGFYQNDLLTEYDEALLQESLFDDDTYILRGLVTIAEMSSSLRHEKYCNYRPCPSCDEHGQTLEIDQLCDKCELTKRE